MQSLLELVVIPTGVLLVVAIVLFLLLLWLGYARAPRIFGFGSHIVKTVETVEYTSGDEETGQPQKRSITTETQSARTLWDWLTVVTISAVLALVAFSYTSCQGKQQRIIQEQQAREAALLSYYDAMSELMFDRKLLTSDAGDPVRDVARARTLVGLLAVGTERQRDVIRFLYESDVIKPGNPENRIVDLTKANLTDAHLNRMPLSGIDLRGANLSDGLDVDTRGAILKAAGFQSAYLGDANLESADLEDANLSKADLTKANLIEANLTGAKGVTQQELEEQTQQLEGAIMPDGSRHD